MQTQNSFSLGAIPKQSNAPTLPLPLDPTQFHTRQEIREHQEAQQYYHEYQRDIETQARIDADNARAKVLAEANRELTDAEYDDWMRKEWQAQKDKQAALVSKEKADALERTAYLLSSPPMVDLLHRGEYNFLKDFEYWASRGYTLGDGGLQAFQPGFYHVQLTAPATTKKAGAK